MSTVWINFKKLFVIFFAATIMTACGSPKVKVNVQADEALNQDNQQRSLPVVLRVYQLRDKSKFEQADFKQLWKQDTTLLASDLLNREEYLVQPGQDNTFKLAKQDATQYIGVVALFRDHIQQHWRVIKPVSHTALTRRLSSSISVYIKDKSITIAQTF